MVSSYQSNFKPTKASKNIQRTSGNVYVSSIMTVTPDPRMFTNQKRKAEEIKASISEIDKNLQQTNSVLKKAMDRALTNNYEADFRDKYLSKISKLKHMFGSKSRLDPSMRTPMPVRVQNLMSPIAQ